MCQISRQETKIGYFMYQNEYNRLDVVGFAHYPI